MTKVVLEKGHLFYSKYEGGDKILIAFHGFGQDKKIFQDWASKLTDEYTIYAFDIFYHGDSDRAYGKLSKLEWKEYLEAFLNQEKIEKFSLLGYSLGGRFAIASSLLLPENTNQLILIAPDGIFLTIWFKLATHPAIRWLFKYFMLRPDRLDTLLAFNDKYKITSPYLGDFVRKELGEEHNRKRVYISWNHFKSLGYTQKELIAAFKKHDFKKRIILGSNDHIIKPAKILPIIDKVGDFKIDILPLKHHQLIKPEVAKLIMYNPDNR
ncbi:MAG: alpha/beta hydrolase [Ekhidna sp.]|uniref:alpha/beta fold hydrolase n=1 Tax=Ekhidna sp. TaxID=2608089 RepID=UPI0032ED2D23